MDDKAPEDATAGSRSVATFSRLMYSYALTALSNAYCTRLPFCLQIVMFVACVYYGRLRKHDFAELYYNVDLLALSSLLKKRLI